MPETYEHNTYERVDQDGAVLERVQPICGDFEDTRLGLLALEDGSGWRLADTGDDTAPETPGLETAAPQVPAPAAEDTPTTHEPAVAAKPARRRNQTKE